MPKWKSIHAYQVLPIPSDFVCVTHNHNGQVFKKVLSVEKEHKPMATDERFSPQQLLTEWREWID